MMVMSPSSMVPTMMGAMVSVVTIVRRREGAKSLVVVSMMAVVMSIIPIVMMIWIEPLTVVRNWIKSLIVGIRSVYIYCYLQLPVFYLCQQIPILFIYQNIIQTMLSIANLQKYSLIKDNLIYLIFKLSLIFYIFCLNLADGFIPL